MNCSRPDMEARFRILAIDDDVEVLNTYQQILQPEEDDTLGDLKRLVDFEDEDEDAHSTTCYEMALATQGMEGVEHVERSRQENAPFAVALVDVRLPPGIDGIETAAKIRAIDPDIYIIIASAYHDYSQQEVVQMIEQPLYFVDKPATQREVNQLVYSNCISWQRDQRLQQQIAENLEHTRNIQQLLEDREAQLRQQSQLFNLHRTTSHTIKNSMSFLNDIAEKAVMCKESGEPLDTLLTEERLNLVESQLHNIHVLTMLSLKESKSATVEKQPLRLLSQIDEVLELFSITKLGRDREIVTRFEGVSEDLLVTMRPIDLQTTLLNLLNNAAAAVDEYFSTLVEEAESAEDFERLSELRNEVLIELEVNEQQDLVVITLRNVGNPIPDEVGARLFERGFTTKSDGNGIGLDDIRSILNGLGGEIGFTNLEQGVEFTVHLPQTSVERNYSGVT